MRCLKSERPGNRCGVAVKGVLLDVHAIIGISMSVPPSVSSIVVPAVDAVGAAERFVRGLSANALKARDALAIK